MNDTCHITGTNGTTYDLTDYRIPTLPADTKNVLNGNGAWASLIDMVYPVGSIYMSTQNTSPATLFGGTWQALENRFLVGAGDTYTAGVTGGEATHTLTASELPQHTHWASGNSQAENGDWGIAEVKNISGTSGVLPVAAGSDRIVPATTYASEASWSNVNLETQTGGVAATVGTAHNNLPPYLPVYMWERTA